MNNRPSATISSISDALTVPKSGRSIGARLVGMFGVGAVVVLAVIGSAGLFVLRSTMGGDEDARIVNAASLSKQLVDRVLAERVRQVDLIASAPQVIFASKKGAAESRRLNLPAQLGNTLRAEVMAGIEERFKSTRSLQVDSASLTYLKGLLPKLDIAEVMLTDQYGYNAVTTSPSSDFVQSDEGWWLAAWNGGSSSAQAT